MKIKSMLMAMAVLATSCATKDSDAPIIGKHNPTIENGRMSPEVLWSFGRLGGVQISPKGDKVLYSVSYFSVPDDKSNSELFVMNTDGTNQKQITKTAVREAAAKWMNDGERIAFLSSDSGSMQLWIMNADGSNRKQITEREGGMSDFAFSPDETKLLFVADIKSKPSTADLHPDLPKSSGILVDDLMYKHWDQWVSTVPHPFVADFDGKSIANEFDLLEGELFESPVRPFGGIEQLAWSPDGKTVAYTSRKKTGVAYAVSTNNDIYFYDLESKQTRNITEGMMGYDMNPAFSPDGQWLAWESMERDGYEADKNRLYIMNVATGEKRDLTADFDQNADHLKWTKDSKSIYFTSTWHARTHIYKVDIATAVKKQITNGDFDYEGAYPAAETLIATRRSMSKPTEIYAVNEATGEATELSFENKHILDKVEMGKVEERWVTTTDNKQMLVWVIYPPQFDPNKKYPTVLYCQGGPQSPVSQFWSYRWNLQTFAANDYIIVAPNRRGLPGFGQAWNEQISGDYSGQNIRDYLSAIDALAKEPFVDETRLGCVGASYGGYSVFYLAGQHEKRFKAFIAHSGIFNLQQQYLETEEMWFANWDMGGAYWDKQNAVAQRTFANSPHLFVDKWDTPILIIHGEKDYRILASQSMSAFNAAKLRGVPAQMLIYPDENHWILKPQNGILWQRTFIGWLDKWLK